MTTRLRLICHASTAAVRGAVFPGDEPLDERGRRRLTRLPALRGVDRAFTAPEMRCHQTAAGLGLDVLVAPELSECDDGEWTGRSLAEVQASDPEGVAAWLADTAATPHGGESLLALMHRVALWLDGQPAQPGSVAAITHASVIRAAVVHAIAASPASFWRIDVAPLCMAELSSTGQGWRLTSLGPLRSP